MITTISGTYQSDFATEEQPLSIGDGISVYSGEADETTVVEREERPTNDVGFFQS